MKKILLLLILVLSIGANAQINEGNETETPGGFFDVVYDKDGNQYQLKDLVVPKRLPETQPTTQATTCTNSGYFDLYFETGCGAEGNNATEIARQQVLCQLFSDISNFITKNINPNDPNSATTRVNIWVRNPANVFGAVPPNMLGAASAFYSLPPNLNSGASIVDGNIHKTIVSGSDAYINVAPPINNPFGGAAGSSTSGLYFHGMVLFNSAVNWNTNLLSLSAAGQYDLYSVMLHEIVHALGFASLINANGSSRLGNTYSAYSHYDLNLTTQAGTHLITNTGSCSLYDYQFNPLLTPFAITPGGCISTGSSNTTPCSTAVKYIGSVNVPVYTPYCYEAGSSLSHFEDECQVPASFGIPPQNDLYYVMSNANGTGAAYAKRYLRDEERAVLCDLGYTVAATYGNNAIVANSQHTYSASCTGLTVGGVNDGIGANGAYAPAFTNQTGNFSLTGANILGNDYNANGFECLEVIIGSGALSTTSGTNATPISITGCANGLTLLRYVPVSLTGERGNITYVYLFRYTTCSGTSCEVISGGNFSSTTGCGSVSGTSGAYLGCWISLNGTPDVLNTVACTTATAAFDGVVNNAFMALASSRFRTSNCTTSNNLESAYTKLNSPLIPGNTYILSFWAKVEDNGVPIGTCGNTVTSQCATTTRSWCNTPVELSFFTDNGTNPVWVSSPNNYSTHPLYSSVVLIPTSSIPQASCIIPATGQWNLYQISFVHTGAIANNFGIANITYKSSNSNEDLLSRIFLDEIKIEEATAAFSIQTPPAICKTADVIPDMASYFNVVPPNGTFSGPGVTCTGIAPNVVCSFNPAAAAVAVGQNIITYTYTDDNLCNQVRSFPINIIANTIGVSLSNPTLCTNGACTTLIAAVSNGNAPYTYNWSNSQTTASMFVCPLPTAGVTTYSVKVTDNAGCVGTATSSVTTMVSPTFTINPVIDHTCNNNNITYSISTGGTYTSVNWSISPTPGVGNTISIANANTISPTINWHGYAGTSVITITLANGPCTTTQTYTVYPCCTDGDPIKGSSDPNNPLVLTNPNYSNTLLSIYGCVSIDGQNAVWENCKIRMQPGAKIIVNKGTLTLRYTHLFSCSAMWDGIYLTNNGGAGSIVFGKNNLIEDAKNAIVSVNGNTIKTSINPGNKVIFNKCGIGIDIRSYPTTNTIYLQGAIFTSRNFNATPTYVSGANPYSIGNQLVPAAYIDNIVAAYPVSNYTNYTSSNCLAPLNNTRGRIGVNVVSNSNTLKVGVESTASGYRNIFDNLLYGIHSYNTNLVSTNNLFIYIQEICNNSDVPCKEAALLTCPNGTAICTNGGLEEPLLNGIPKYTFVGTTGKTSYPCYFEQDQYGIYNGQNVDLRAANNDFKIIDQTAIHNQFGSHYSPAPWPAPSNNLIVLNNKIDRAKVAINFVDNRNANISIAGNKINYFNAPAMPATSTQQGTDGIKVSNVNYNSVGRCYVYNNDIANVQRGITLTKQGYTTTRMATAYDNAIYFNQFQSIAPTTLHYGIGLYGCQNVNLNGYKNIAQKDITRNIPNAANIPTLNTAAQAQLFRGIYVENSPGTWVTKFNIVKLPASIYAQGSCTNSNFWCNKLNTALNGFYFNNADIGTQLNMPGYANYATDNEWLNPVASNNNIRGVVSPAINWYYHLGLSPVTTAGLTGITFSVSTSTLTPCGFVPALISDGEDGPGNSSATTGNPNTNITPIHPTPPERELLYGKPVNNNLNYIDLLPERALWAHRFTERMLKNNPDIINLGAPNDALYQNYVNTQQQLNTGKLREVNDAINNKKERLLLEQQNNAIVTDNPADAASKELNRIYIKTWYQHQNLSNADSIYVCELAGQNPIIYGDAVYGAQVMIGEECISITPPANNARIANTNDETKEQISAAKNNTAKIYPNPNNGLMQAEITLNEGEQGTLSIHSIDGKLIESYKLNSGENKFDIQQEQLPAGVYFHKLFINAQHIETKKIIIVK